MVSVDQAVYGMKHDLSEILDFIDREQGFYEIVPKGYSKATAIRYITDYLKIPMEDTVAIGDSNNDYVLRKKEYRKAKIPGMSYVVIYQVDKDIRTVYVMGIFHELENYGIKL